MNVPLNNRTLLQMSHQVFLAAATSVLFAEPALAGPVKDGLCAGIAVTESILPAVIAVAATGGAAYAMYMKVGGEWVQSAMKGVLAAGILGSSAAIGGHVAGAKAKALFDCSGGAGAMQVIINSL